MTTICLGCGQPYPVAAYCPDCERKAVRLIQMSHWPLETSISSAALRVLEELIRDEISGESAVANELHNLANIIRAHLQHTLQAPAAKSAPVADDWLG